MAIGPAVVCLMIWVPAAHATSPANDNFSNAQLLSSSLPVEVSGTNVGATKEPEEPTHNAFFDAGHSVWFKWEATTTRLVTVSLCDSGLGGELAVYRGSALNALTAVAANSHGEGIACLADESEATFKAVGGTTYYIAVDGDAFYLPPASPPVTEGSISLQIRQTPDPANDDFASAMALTGEVLEKEGESIYRASVLGSNWNATKEPGEPDHQGDPGGASVWYAWTAPFSGHVEAFICTGIPLELGIYTGSALGSLTPVASEGFSLCQRDFYASAGMVYRIAVDGRFVPGTGEAAMTGFALGLFMGVPELPPSADQSGAPGPSVVSAPRDTRPPNTTIDRREFAKSGHTVSFRFSANEPEARFRCKIDAGAFVPCASPKTYHHLAPGRHMFSVAAVDTGGNVDPTPAVVRLKVGKR